MRAAPSPARMFWLLTRLRLIRLFNLIGAVGHLSRWRKQQGRQGTATKGKVGSILAVAIVLMMVFAAGNIARLSLHHLHGRVDQPAGRGVTEQMQHTSPGKKAMAPDLEPGPFSPALAGASTGLLALLLLVITFTDLGARELAKQEWDMEWLITLPIATKTLLWARLLERSASNGLGIVGLVPLCAVLAWYSGLGWWSPLVGFLAALPLLALCAVGRTVVDVGTRLSLSPSQLRNLQATLSLLGMLGLFLVSSISSGGSTSYGFDLVTALPAWAIWSPPGLVVLALNSSSVWHQLLYASALAVQTFFLAWVCMAWVRHQLRQGLVAAGSRETARATLPVAASARAPRFALLGSALQRRELTLLGRDRNFLVQTLLVPVLVIGGQFVMNNGVGGLARIWSSPAFAAAAAFGVASYMLIFSAFQTINTEGPGLWLLYTFPRSIGTILKEKAQLWGVLALVYPLLILLPGVFVMQDVGWSYGGNALLAVVGVPIYAVIAVALGVFASNPLATEQGTRLRPSYMYLFFLLSGFYGYGIWMAQWWQSLEIVLLTALLAFALWQKAADHLPYLLDPTAAPPARVSASDGLIAAMMFLVLQIVIAAIWHAARPQAGGAALLGSFAGAGALTYGLTRLVYWRSKTAQVPRMLGQAQASVWRVGLGLGAVAAAIGVLYLWLVQHFEVLNWSTPAATGDSSLKYWLLPLTILAAPIFEEFIFRGLIFDGLRRSMRLLPAAAASAAVFAMVHPPASIIPVFFVGLCTAVAYERTRMLAAPMLTHALYNAVVVGYQFAQASS